MVFVWRADKPEEGALPFHLYPLPEKRENVKPLAPQVPPEIAAWIHQRGGQRCIGAPVTEAAKEGDRLCQTFTNTKLCYDTKTKQVVPQPVGREFLQAKGKLLLPTLPTAVQPVHGWTTQVSLSLEGNRHLQVTARVFNNKGEPSRALAVQIGDAGAPRAFYYGLVPASVMHDGVWETTLTLPKLPPGKHTIVAKVCAVSVKGCLACDEDSVPLKITAEEK